MPKIKVRFSSPSEEVLTKIAAYFIIHGAAINNRFDNDGKRYAIDVDINYFSRLILDDLEGIAGTNKFFFGIHAVE